MFLDVSGLFEEEDASDEGDDEVEILGTKDKKEIHSFSQEYTKIKKEMFLRQKTPSF